MNKAKKLKICNKSLGITTLLILVSGIHLEATSGSCGWSVWLHIVLGVMFTVLVLYHVYLHYGLKNWFARFVRNKNTVMRILWWLLLLTVASGIIASIHWINLPIHSTIGGIHGKIGFLMVILTIIHVAKHKKKFKNKHIFT